MTQNKIVLGGVLLALVVVAGCTGGPVTGTPTALTSSVATSGSAGEDGPGASLAGVDPCTLMTNQQAATFGLAAGRPEKAGNQRECQYSEIGADAPVSGAVTIDPTHGIDVLRTPGGIDQAGIRKTVVDRRRVNYYPDADGLLCTVNVEVNKRENVTVQITLNKANTPEPACQIAEKVVGVVLPKMPKK